MRTARYWLRLWTFVRGKPTAADLADLASDFNLRVEDVDEDIEVMLRRRSELELQRQWREFLARVKSLRRQEDEALAELHEAREKYHRERTRIRMQLNPMEREIMNRGFFADDRLVELRDTCPYGHLVSAMEFQRVQQVRFQARQAELRMERKMSRDPARLADIDAELEKLAGHLVAIQAAIEDLDHQMTNS